MSVEPSNPSQSDSSGNVKDEIDALVKLEEATWREFHQRRSYEWKINFALWAGLGTVSGFAIKENVLLTSWLWVGLGILEAIYVWWHVGLFTSNSIDQQKRNHYLEEIRRRIHVTLPENLRVRPRTSSTVFYKNWSHSSQIVITFLFLMLAGYVLTVGPRHIVVAKKSNAPIAPTGLQIVAPDSSRVR